MPTKKSKPVPLTEADAQLAQARQRAEAKTLVSLEAARQNSEAVSGVDRARENTERSASTFMRAVVSAMGSLEDFATSSVRAASEAENAAAVLARATKARNNSEPIGLNEEGQLNNIPAMRERAETRAREHGQQVLEEVSRNISTTMITEISSFHVANSNVYCEIRYSNGASVVVRGVDPIAVRLNQDIAVFGHREFVVRKLETLRSSWQRVVRVLLNSADYITVYRVDYADGLTCYETTDKNEVIERLRTSLRIYGDNEEVRNALEFLEGRPTVERYAFRVQTTHGTAINSEISAGSVVYINPDGSITTAPGGWLAEEPKTPEKPEQPPKPTNRWQAVDW